LEFSKEGVFLIHFWSGPARNEPFPMEPKYLITFASVAQSPDLFKGPFLNGFREPRIALVGRSNVGKSTLINALLGVRLAQTSHQPGKTRAVHFYHWPKAGKILADLPGYGYALAAKTERENWEKFIAEYFKQDEGLQRAVVLLDSRHGPTDLDLNAIQFLSLQSIPVTFVFTKVDALKTQAQRAARQKEAVQALKKLGIQFDPERSHRPGGSLSDTVFWVSSHDKHGLKPLIQHLSQLG
jgi:GTP-binding protein